MTKNAWIFTTLAVASLAAAHLSLDADTEALGDGVLRPIDVFGIEYASDPQISPDGQRVAYVRNFMDIMKDRRRSNIWIVQRDGSEHRPITTGNTNDTLPRWAPDGNRLIYVSKLKDGGSQIFCRWRDTGQTAKLSNLTSAPSSLSWSPDGRWIAFSMHVPSKPEHFVKLPSKPEGAKWAAPAKVIRKVRYRYDGQGYLKDGFHHLFVLSSDGGTPRQLTSGDYNHREQTSWTADSKSLIFSSNRRGDWEYERRNSEVYAVSLDDRRITALTERNGPDDTPVVSPDGEKIAYVGFEDALRSSQIYQLSVMNRDGGNQRAVTGNFDRSIQAPRWSPDGQSLLFLYDDQGTTNIGSTTLTGSIETVATAVGGTTIGRPYPGGSFSVAKNGAVAFTRGTALRPADVAIVEPGAKARVLTALNEDLLGNKQLGQVEELSYTSSHDGKRIQSWVVKPPKFDAKKKYPLILEIHGGPFENYGPRFSIEIQLYAAAGYVVLYANPRGSTSYGEAFANEIHHAYPGHDYEDLMSGVDAVLALGYVDVNKLFVTGGSGGGVLTSWIVGKTNRFRAAVAAKPVINWYSFCLTADAYTYFNKYWFKGFPWEEPEHYLARSPISLVGNVTTPTMLLTGEDDFRTPIAESEQFYQALKLRRVETALVRIPGTSHRIVARPSVLMSKVLHILKWFEKHH